MSLYNILLHAHGGFRWVVLLLSAVLIIKSVIGLFGQGQYGKLDNILSASFVGFMHLQLLIGLILYFFLSPVTTGAFSDFGSAMKIPEIRFWAIEHITVMILAVASAQVGRSISKKAPDSKLKFRYQAIFYSISLVLMLIAIPWNRF